MSVSRETNLAVSKPLESVSFELNGRSVEVAAHPERSLLTALRGDLGVLSPKNGCEPQAACGCCTVLIDSAPRLACALKVTSVQGKRVTTAEGLSPEVREQLAQAFVRSGGVQCGFCIPGMAMRAVALTQRNANPTRDEISHDLRGNLCRCTGYTKIIDAVQQFARLRKGEPLPSTDTSGRIGTRLDRVRGREFVLGDFQYVDDRTVEGMVFAAMRFSDHPRAWVKAIDARPALAMPGVHRVITAVDVPGNRYVGLIKNDWPILVAIGEETRCVGDIIAVVVADTQQVAREAGQQVIVDYEVLEPLTEPRRALAPGAPKIHPDGNLLSRSAFTRGDPEEAFAQSKYVVEETYHTQRIEHMYLEPEACIATPEFMGDGCSNSNTETIDRRWAKPARPHCPASQDSATQPQHGHASVDHAIQTDALVDKPVAPNSSDSSTAQEHTTHNGVSRVKVLTQGQGVFDDQRQIAGVLGWPKEQVDVELVSNGGAFGGKEDMSIQAQTALAAVLVGRAVKCTLTREESFRLHPKRHPIEIAIKVGCDESGHLRAVKARMIGDKGAYASVGGKVLERAAGHAVGPYRVPNVDIESLAVYTNNPPCGAMRGFGANQAAFAIERSLDRLARQVGIDGWEIRWRNILNVGERFCTGQVLDKPFGLKETMLAVKDAYRSAKYAGIACGIKNVGIGNGLADEGKAVLTVESEDRVVIRTGFTEMGQGYFTVCVQTACEETGLPPEVFETTTDTSVDVNCGQTTASRATVLGGLAVMQAARKLKIDLEWGRSLEDLVGRSYRGEYACTYTTKPDADVPDPKTHLTYGFATQVVILDEEGALKKVVAAHDVGKVINPTLLEGQMEGSIHMGLGYALSEDFVVEGGHIVSKDIKSLHVFRAHHMPEIETIFIEKPDPETAYGARGVGEIGLVPTAPAVAGALEAFDGIHRTRLPMKDSPAGQAILKNKKRGGRGLSRD